MLRTFRQNGRWPHVFEAKFEALVALRDPEAWKPDKHPGIRIPLPQSTATRISFSNQALLLTLVLEMHEQAMGYREIGKGVSMHWTHVGHIIKAK
jgi:hypothetical protein